MFGNKKLKERIEILEIIRKNMEDKLVKQNELAKFLLKYDKKDIIVEFEPLFSIFNDIQNTIVVRFIYNDELVVIRKQCPLDTYEVGGVDNITSETDLIHIVNSKNKDTYFQLDKPKKELSDVTAIANHFDEQSGIVQNLKSSSESLLNAIDKLVSETTDSDKGKKKDKNSKIIADKKINIRKERPSKLKKYYDKFDLNLRVKDFNGCEYISEKDVATLLYLYDRYKYMDEILKHIDLKKTTLERYSHALKKNNYLIFNHGMGRVANGCLIYEKKAV